MSRPPEGMNPSCSFELPTKLVLISSKLIGAATSAAAASVEPAGDVAMSRAHDAAKKTAPAITRIFTGFRI